MQNVDPLTYLGLCILVSLFLGCPFLVFWAGSDGYDARRRKRHSRRMAKRY